MPRIARKPQNGLYEFPCSVMEVQYLALWRNSYPYLTMVSCCRWSCAGLQIWRFWSQILKIRLFLTHLAFLENQKYQSISGFFFYIFFSLKGLALAKHCLNCIFITNLFEWESMTMQGAKNIAKILLLP